MSVYIGEVPTFADVVQAVRNLVSAYGIHHFNDCMDECRARNDERGRKYAQA